MLNPITNFFQQQLTTSDRDSLRVTYNSLAVKKSLKELVIKFLERDNWEYTMTQNSSILRMACEGKNGKWMCYAKIKEAEAQFAFYSVFPNKVPLEKLLTIAEFITRANYGLMLGNFELDFNDGEIRYKTSVDAQEIELNINAIAQIIYTNVLIMDRYFPGILSVIEQNEPPEKAISAIESSLS